jgi:hypothetical protein
MSTPALILIEHGETRVYLYRHHDGNPCATGADLVTHIRNASYYRDSSAQSWAPDPNELIAAMITAKYSDGREVYEVTANTNCGANYFYHVKIPDYRGVFLIGWAKRGRDEREVSRIVDGGSLEKFVSHVNHDILITNHIIEQHKRANLGNQAYDHEPLALLPETFTPNKRQWHLIQDAHEAAQRDPEGTAHDSETMSGG